VKSSRRVGRARAMRTRAAYRLRAALHARAQARGSMERDTSCQMSGGASAQAPAASEQASQSQHGKVYVLHCLKDVLALAGCL